MYGRTLAKKVPNYKQAYITKKALEDLWRPLHVPGNSTPSVKLQARLQDMGKKTAIETREGNAYEGKAVLFDNPFKVVDLDNMALYGQLNNMTDEEIRTIEKLREPIVKKIDGSPERFNQNNATGKRRKIAAVPAWTKAQRDNYFEDNPYEGALYKASPAILRKGRETLKKILKHGGHFNKAHVASVEWLVSNRAVWAKGKGTFWLDPDYLAYEKPNTKYPNGRWVIIELKKGYGKIGDEEAQQLRKVAGLVRSWTLRYNGKLPAVELYFAAGDASNFGKNYQFTRESGYLNTSNNSKIIANMSKGGVIKPKYYQIPIHLLTGRGMASFIHADPRRVKKITEGITKTYDVSEWAAALQYINRKYDISNKSRNLNIKSDPSFIATVPEYWRPREINKNFNTNIRNVAKLQAYRSSRSRAYKNAAANNPKKQTYLLQLMRAEKTLLSNKYRKYLNANFATKLAAKYAKRSSPYKNQFEIRPITGNDMGAKFLGKILKYRSAMRVSPGKNERVRQRQFNKQAIPSEHISRENVVYPSNMNSRYLNSLTIENVKKIITKFRTMRGNVSNENRNKAMANLAKFKAAFKHSKFGTGTSKNLRNLQILVSATGGRANRTPARGRSVAPNISLKK